MCRAVCAVRRVLCGVCCAACAVRREGGGMWCMLAGIMMSVDIIVRT